MPEATPEVTSTPDGLPDVAHPEAPASGLPVHVFTIVLNGEPFIRFHEEMLRRLPFRWHWHVVEGVAALRHDTAWSTATGGRVTDAMHRAGRSKDGTSEYLDDLAARFPGQVTIYRKPPGVFWDGKREMVNAPLPNITEPCLLWQMDNDELWTVEQVTEVRRRFMAEPDRGAAYYWCWYFVGPDKVVSTRNNYAQNPAVEWLRTWRYEPGDTWAAHEPPTLVRPRGEGQPPLDIATLRPFSHDETEAFGAVFQHFAYVTEEQLGFKEDYYGYAGARAQWRTLLETTRPGFLADHFGWVGDRTMFDDAAVFRVQPLAWPGADGRWCFAVPEGSRTQGAVAARPRILLDGVCWQYRASGIGRMWQAMLEAWVARGLADHVIVLDRAGTAPRIPGVHYRTIAAHDYGRCGADSLYLERLCGELGADLLVSTRYSTPTETPSYFLGEDMVPETTGRDLTEETWQEKARAIRHASGHAMIARSAARDLARLFPHVAEESVDLVECAPPPGFTPAAAAEIEQARRSLRLPDPYILLVGESAGAARTGMPAFQAAALVAARGLKLGIVHVGGGGAIEPALRAAAPSVATRCLDVDDATLRLLYAGAHALVQPSAAAGNRAVMLEALACGCPVVTCCDPPPSDIGAAAAIHVAPDAPEQVAAALEAMADPIARAARVEAGLAEAARLRAADQAGVAMAAFRRTIDALSRRERQAPGRGWREFRTYQDRLQALAQERPDVAASLRTAAGGDAGTTAPVRATAELLRALAEIEAMQRSPFWRLRSTVLALLRATGIRRR